MHTPRSVFAAAVLLAVLPPVSAAEPAPGRNYIGINPWFLNDWDESNAFADIAVHGRNWQAAADWHDPVAVDAEGWPLADASTVFFGTGNTTGKYHLRFEGQAQKVQVMWLGGKVDSLSWDAATNTSTAVVTLTGPMGGSGGLALTGTRRTASSALGSGFRDLHLWRPGYPADGSRLFTDEWEALMRRFQVVRFMDWGATNGNPIVSWSDRRKPSDANHGEVEIQGRKGDLGLPIEFMVALCNRTGTDAWINVPPLADSGYVANLVKTVLYGSDGKDPYSSPQANPVWKPLAQDLKLYLEHGNELWNFAGGFNGFHWMHEQSEALRAGARTEPIFHDAQNDEWVSLFRWMGWRAAQTALWARSVAGDAMMTRVRPLLEGQIGYHAMTGNILPFLETWYSVPRGDRTRTYRMKEIFWGNGGAPYSKSADTTKGFFEAGNYPEKYIPSAIGGDAILAGAYGLHRVAYEGGPALDDFADSVKSKIFSDPRMEGLVVDHHHRWTSHGGELAVYYCALGAENWRFARTASDTLSPKMKAVKTLVAEDAAAPAALGCVAPCRMRPDTVSNTFGDGGFWTASNALWGFDPGEWRAFPVSLPVAGQWKLVLRAHADKAGDSLQILVSDSLVATRAVSDLKTFSAIDTVALDLPAGLTVIRLRGKAGQTAVSDIEWVAGRSIGVGSRTEIGMRRRIVLLGRNGSRGSLDVPLDARSVDLVALDGRLVATVALDPVRSTYRPVLPGGGLYFATIPGETAARRVFLP